MYDNIGYKIKCLSTVIFAIMAVISVISGIAIIFILEVNFFIGLISAGVGVLLSWISSLILYGFGQLVENSDILVKEATTPKSPVTPKTYATVKNCPHCGELINSKYCDMCGKENDLF